MSVKYSLALMSSKPSVKNAPKLYYAKAQADGEVTIDNVAEEIAYATTLTDGDVLNVLRALIRQINKNLAAGKIVRLENLGTFQMQLGSKGTETKKAFSSENIVRARIQFRPGKMVKATTRTGDGGLEFQQVSSKPKKTSGKNNSSGQTGSNKDTDPLG